MSLDPPMRASDADRESVVERLRDAHAEGRLTIEEFQERLDGVYAARTVAELVTLTRDLPAAPARQHGQDPHGWPGWRAVWGSWATATLVTTAIWAMSGFGYFWPGWVAGPWGALLLARTLTAGGAPERPGRRDGEVDHR